MKGLLDLQLVQQDAVVPLLLWLRLGHQLLVLVPETSTKPAKHVHDAQLVLGVSIH